MVNFRLCLPVINLSENHFKEGDQLINSKTKLKVQYSFLVTVVSSRWIWCHQSQTLGMDAQSASSGSVESTSGSGLGLRQLLPGRVGELVGWGLLGLFIGNECFRVVIDILQFKICIGIWCCVENLYRVYYRLCLVIVRAFCRRYRCFRVQKAQKVLGLRVLVRWGRREEKVGYCLLDSFGY